VAKKRVGKPYRLKNETVEELEGALRAVDFTALPYNAPPSIKKPVAVAPRGQLLQLCQLVGTCSWVGDCDRLVVDRAELTLTAGSIHGSDLGKHTHYGGYV
jgi:hypothetical protein